MLATTLAVYYLANAVRYSILCSWPFPGVKATVMKKIILDRPRLCFQWALRHSYKFTSLIMMRRAEQVAWKIQMCDIYKFLLGESQGKRILRRKSAGKYTSSSAESVTKLSISFYEPFCVKNVSTYGRVSAVTLLWVLSSTYMAVSEKFAI
jgi:hypothetical protein